VCGSPARGAGIGPPGPAGLLHRGDDSRMNVDAPDRVDRQRRQSLKLARRWSLRIP
jgi:hypothetical protein